MRNPRRIAATVGLLAILAFILSGCIHEDRSVNLHGDGSGTYTLTLGVNSQLVSLSGDDFVQSMNDYGEKLNKQGSSSKHYDQDGYSYWAYTRPFKSVDELNTQLTELPETNTSTPGTTPTPQPSATDTFKVTQQSNFLLNTFHVTGSMSLVIPGSDDPNVDQTTKDLLKDARESFAVTMPNWVTSHQGGVVNGNTVTYTVHLNERATIDVVGGGINTVVYPIGGGILVLLLLVVALVSFLLLRRRKVDAPVPVMAPAASFPVTDGYGYRPPTMSQPYDQPPQS
jgi:hypothetical protein